jgi:hypothetical protein
MTIASLADLRPGDIMFGPIGGVVPGLFPVGVGQAILGETFHVGRLSIRHVGIVVETGERSRRSIRRRRSHTACRQPRLVQAMPHGAEEIPMTPDTHWTDRHAYVRLPEDYPGQAEDAAAIARLFVTERVSYSFASYAALAAWKYGLRTPRLEAWIGRRRRADPSSSCTQRLGHSVIRYRAAVRGDLLRPRRPGMDPRRAPRHARRRTPGRHTRRHGRATVVPPRHHLGRQRTRSPAPPAA